MTVVASGGLEWVMEASGRRTVLVLDPGALAADMETVDALARLQLAAHRCGARLDVRGPSDELQDLLAFLGLSQLLGRQACGESEQREESFGVEEEGQVDDAAP